MSSATWDAPGTPTYTVSQLAHELKAFLGEAFWDVQVVGELERQHRSRPGHLYLELVEKGDGDRIVGKLDAVIFRNDLQQIEGRLRRAGQRLESGQKIRCAGRLDLYPPTGRLQLIIRDVDPDFSLGEMERRRRENLLALEAAGLLERNRALDLPAVPLRIGLVTSAGSAAYHDFVSGLAASGYGFRVVFVHASVQGRTAESEVASALELLGRLGLDAVALVRGGGARSDLAAFDSRTISEAVARCPIPVLSGLGHEIDRSVTDRVAHTALKTPTQVAEILVDRVERAERAVLEARAALIRVAERRLERARTRVAGGRQIARLAHLRVSAARGFLAELRNRLQQVSRRRVREAERRQERLRERLVGVARRPLQAAARRPEDAVARLLSVARARLETARVRIDGLDRAARAVAPQRILDRGFSLTTDAQGRPLRRPTDVAIGDTITTRLAEGELTSRVEAS